MKMNVRTVATLTINDDSTIDYDATIDSFKGRVEESVAKDSELANCCFDILSEEKGFVNKVAMISCVSQAMSGKKITSDYVKSFVDLNCVSNQNGILVESLFMTRKGANGGIQTYETGRSLIK